MLFSRSVAQEIKETDGMLPLSPIGSLETSEPLDEIRQRLEFYSTNIDRKMLRSMRKIKTRPLLDPMTT